MSRFEEGTFRLLNYDEGTTSWEQLLKNGTRLDTGYYMLTTGTRLANGGVLANLSFFNVEKDHNATVDLVMRESETQVQVIGSFDSESLFRPVGDHDQMQSILQAALGKDFEKWGRKIVLLFPDEEQYKKFQPTEFPGLPSTIIYGIDTDGNIQKQITESMKLSSSAALPVFIIADTFNRVVFVSQGYTIGLGEQLMKVVHGL